MKDLSQGEFEPAEPVQHGRAYDEMMKLFEEMSFWQKMKAAYTGINCPKDSGEYKFAKLQIQLLAGPLLAIVLPLLLIAFLLTLQSVVTQNEAVVAAEVVEIEPPPEIEDPPPELPETVEFKQMDTDYDGPTENFNPEVNVANDQPLSPKPAEINSVSLNKSPITMRGIVGSRNPGARGAALSRFGGSPGGEATVLRALRWLKSKQQENGSWPGNTISNTGLSLLAYLAHGDVPNPETNPEFAATVEKGIRYLVEQQNDNGLFRGSDGNQYAHLIATYALAEAYTLTATPMLKTAVEKAARHIVEGQHPSGGWDYKMAQSDRDDTSFAGWAAQAVKAVKMAKDTHGLDVPKLEEVYARSVKGFQKNAHQSGGFGYTGRGRSGLSGVGVLCMQLMGAAREPEVSATMAFLSECKFSFANWDVEQPWGNQGSPIYYWYYVTQAKFHHGGNTWREWNKIFAPELISNQQIIRAEAATEEGRNHRGQYGMVVETRNVIQDHEGKWRDIGYWDSPSASEHDGTGGGVRYDPGRPGAPNRWAKGIKLTDAKDCTTTDGQRVQMTTLCALQMMVYYRYLPTFQTPTEEAPQAAAADSGKGEIEVTFF